MMTVFADLLFSGMLGALFFDDVPFKLNQEV
jgi:hypothetical protein